MASLHSYLLTNFCLLFLVNPYSIYGKTSFRPKQLVLPITKNSFYHQYIATIHQRTPLVPVKLALDLNSPSLWVDCELGYVSSSYKRAKCGSPICKLPSTLVNCTNCTPTIGFCHSNSCAFIANNPAAFMSWPDAEISQDVLSIRSTNGSNLGRAVSVPKFTFTCAVTYMLAGFAKGVTGMAGLGRNNISLPSQFSSAFKFDNKFAICLSSTKGVVFFGDAPYVLQHEVDVAKSLIYTPLLRNPINVFQPGFETDPSVDYYIGVRSILVNGIKVPLDQKLLKINKNGYGGTKFSTVNPYTIMHSSVFEAFFSSFTKELGDVPRVDPTGLFDICYNSTFIGTTKFGPKVPTIDLVLENGKVFLRISGSKSMVKVGKDVICLAIVYSPNAVPAIVIGGHHIEEHLLQFDIANSRLGFSSSILSRNTSCANFNFFKMREAF